VEGLVPLFPRPGGAEQGTLQLSHDTGEDCDWRACTKRGKAQKKTRRGSRRKKTIACSLVGRLVYLSNCTPTRNLCLGTKSRLVRILSRGACVLDTVDHMNLGCQKWFSQERLKSPTGGFWYKYPGTKSGGIVMFQRGRKNFLVRGLDGTSWHPPSLESRESFGQVSFSSDVLSQVPCQGGMGG
jgi:hypothetical protein